MKKARLSPIVGVFLGFCLAATSALADYSLTIVSDHGTPSPVIGLHIYPDNSVLTNSISNSDIGIRTQYVGAGWALIGNVSTNGLTNGAGSVVVLQSTNDATLVWMWKTNFSLRTFTDGTGDGTVNIGAAGTTGGWFAANTTVALAASRAAGSHLAGWTGDTNGCTVSNVTLLVPMTQARSITARFNLDTPPLFTEDFEGDFPSGWDVGNTSTRSTACWGAVDNGFGGITNATGVRMGYCAGVGYAGTDANPTYQNRMASYMQRTVDLSGYSGATLNFQSFIAGIDAHFDFARVLVNGTKLWEKTTADSAWTAEAVNLNKYAGNAAVTIRFEFDSDGSLTRTGWFIDDINLTVVAGDTFDEANATPIDVNTNVTDPPISEPGGQSTFLVKLRQGYSYTITVTPGTLKDPQVSLFDTNRILLAHNDDAQGLGLGSRITFVSYETAGYFIQVGAYGNGTGSFTLRVDEAVPQADVAATAVSVKFPDGDPPPDPRGQNPDILTYSIHNYGPMGLDNGETYSYRIDVYLSTSKTTAGTGVRIGSETITLNTPSGGDSADLAPSILSDFTVTNSLAAGTYYAWLHIVPLSGAPADPKAANNWVCNVTTAVNVPPPEQVTISGRVTKPGGVTGVANVTIYALNFDGSLTNTATTSATGAYSLIVPGGWTGKLMPTNNVLGTFTKPFLSLVNVVADKPSQNFVWKPAPTISGRVMRSGTGTGVQGVAIAFSAVGVVTTGLGGVYSQTVPSGWSGTATATFTNGRFSAASRTYRNVTADKTLQNYTWIAPTVVPHATVVTQAAPAAQILAFPSAILMRSRGTVRWTGSDAAQLRALGGEVAIRLVAGAGTVCLPIPVSAPGDADWNLSIEANAIEFLGTLDAELVDIFLANGQAAARAPRYGTTMSGPVNLQDDGDTIVLNWDLTLTR